LYLGTWSKSVTACLTAVKVYDLKNMMDSVITISLIAHQTESHVIKFTSSGYA
jgi:hypothetical protein